LSIKKDICGINDEVWNHPRVAEFEKCFVAVDCPEDILNKDGSVKVRYHCGVVDGNSYDKVCVSNQNCGKSKPLPDRSGTSKITCD